MRLSKAALEAEGWRPRAPETPEPPKPEPKPEPIREPEGPSAAELLAPVLADLAAALRTKQQPVVVPVASPSALRSPITLRVSRDKAGMIQHVDVPTGRLTFKRGADGLVESITFNPGA